jgi:hypothetical protein
MHLRPQTLRTRPRSSSHGLGARGLLGAVVASRLTEIVKPDGSASDLPSMRGHRDDAVEDEKDRTFTLKLTAGMRCDGVHLSRSDQSGMIVSRLGKPEKARSLTPKLVARSRPGVAAIQAVIEIDSNVPLLSARTANRSSVPMFSM